MPMFVAVSTIQDDAKQRIFNDVRVYVVPTQDDAVEKARGDLAAYYPGLKMLSGSIIGVTPETVREAYAELASTGGLQ